jgi:hypothetical protein
MKALSFAPEIYGRYARFSAVADFMELCALSKNNQYVRVSDLERALDKEGIKLSSPLGPRAQDAQQSASIVFGLLQERSRILCDLYPFKADRQEGLIAHDESVGIYRLMLALSTAHAYSVDNCDARRMFEQVVPRSIQMLGLRSTTTGTSRRRSGGGFSAMLESACSDVGLEASVDGLTISEGAKDEKVDTLAHLDFGDGRCGKWTFIGQSTVAESGEWEEKASEPKTKLWRPLISETHEPSSFLAVPHHVELSHLRNLHERCDAVVLDRLRLSRAGITLTQEEHDVVNAVAAYPVEW